jgi:hypothetical protein
VADLRGDRGGQGQAARLRLRGRPVRRGRQPGPEADQGVRALPPESLVVDPRRGTVYLTEDATAPNGLLYRWTPPAEALPLRHGSLRGLADDAGTLEALTAFTAAGAPVPDLSAATEPGTTYAAHWAVLPDATRRPCRPASSSPTAPSPAALDPEAETIDLKLQFAFTPADQDDDPDGPDNITVSAFGGLIIAEDGDGVNHLIGSTPSGQVFFFARNDHPENSEFAGPNFSHDRKSLFANVQSPGFVYAIQGPFRKQR